MYEILIEELMEKRDFYLYTIKHIEFKRLSDDDDENSNSYETKKLMDTAIDELKKVEDEIRKLLKNTK